MFFSHILHFLLHFFLLLCFFFLVLQAYSGSLHQSSTFADRVYLLTVSSLTFTTGALTTARRGTPRPQLHCVAGDACKNPDLIPDHVECYNLGIDEDADQSSQDQFLPQWHCVTVLHRNVRMQNWQVKCEGYSYENDAYVLRGSCWLDFELVYAQQQADDEQSNEGNEDADGEKGERSGAARQFWSVTRNLFVASLSVALLVWWWWWRGEARRTQGSVAEAEWLLANVNADECTDRTSAR